MRISQSTTTYNNGVNSCQNTLKFCMGTLLSVGNTAVNIIGVGSGTYVLSSQSAITSSYFVNYEQNKLEFCESTLSSNVNELVYIDRGREWCQPAL